MAISKKELADFFNALNENDPPYSLKAIKASQTDQQAIQSEFIPRWQQRVNLAKSYVNNPNFDNLIQNIQINFFETATSEKSKLQDFSLANLQSSPIPYIQTPGKIDGATYAKGLGNPCCVIAGHPTHIGGSAFRANQYGGAGDVQEEMYTDNLPLSVAIAAKLGGGIHNGEFQYTQNVTEKLNNRGALLVRGIEHNGQIYSAIISVAPDLFDKNSPYVGLVNENGTTNLADPRWAIYAKEIYKMYDNFSAAAKADPNQPIVLTGLGAGVFSAQSDEAKLIQGICLRLALENHPELKAKASAGLLHLPYHDKTVMAGFNLSSNNPNFNNLFKIVNDSHKQVQLEKKPVIAPTVQASTFDANQLLKNYLNTNQNDLAKMGYTIKTFANGMVIMDPNTKEGLYLSKLGEFGNPAGKHLSVNEDFKNRIMNDIQNISVMPKTIAPVANQNITLYNAPGNQLAIKFPNQAAQQAFLASIGGQQFFPAHDKFNAGKPCPTSVDPTNHVVYFTGYPVMNGDDAGSLGIAFANEGMRNNFYNTLLAKNQTQFARRYQGNATLYVHGLSPQSINNPPIQLDISQTTLNPILNKDVTIKPHEQVVISPQEAQNYLAHMERFKQQLDPNWVLYNKGELAGVVLNIQSALSAIAQGKDNYQVAFGGMGRYTGISLPENPREALLYAMNENIYGQLPPQVKGILDSMRHDIVHKERVVDPRFVAEQDALNAAKPLMSYLAANFFNNPNIMLGLHKARNDENRGTPLGAVMESLGFRITTGRHGTLEFNLMNCEFNVDLNNINNSNVKLNFAPGQESLHKIQPEKIEILISEMKKLQDPVNQFKPEAKKSNETPLTPQQKQAISDFTQTHQTTSLLKESHLLHHQGETGVLTQFDGAQNNKEKAMVQSIGKDLQNLNHQHHTNKSVDADITKLEKKIDSFDKKTPPHKQKNGSPTFGKSAFKEFLTNLKEGLQTLRSNLGFTSKNKLSTQHSQDTKKTQPKHNRR